MKSARNLSLALCFVTLGLSAHGQNWNQATTTNAIWYSMAGSQHGSNLVAAVLSYDLGYSTPGQIYASTNGGQNWTLTSAPDYYWISVAASTNGMRVVAAAEADSDFNPVQIFVSTDGGLNWTNGNVESNSWQAVASSADGQILAGAAYNDSIYISTNGGLAWTTNNAPNNNWHGLAMSADGLEMYAAAPDGIYVSTNTGSLWNLSSNSPPLCFSLVCSADGRRVFTGLEGGDTNYNLVIFASTNGGATWMQTSAPIDITQNYQCLAMSTYGDVLLAGAYSDNNTAGLIYLSTDAGATWIPQTAPTNSWGCVFCSADGTLLTAGEFGGTIYSASNPVINPNLSIKVDAQNSLVSWPVFPAGFQLQMASTLNPPVDWTNTVSDIIESGTNYYTTNSLTSSSAFFRLARP